MRNIPNEPAPNEPAITKEDAIKRLDEIIPNFAERKTIVDDLTKYVESDKAIIKSLLVTVGSDKYTTGGYTVTRSVSNIESVNEDKLLEVMKKHKIPVIATKEYVDMTALEDWLYKNEASKELATDMAACRSTTQVVQLRVGKEKKKKEAE